MDDPKWLRILKALYNGPLTVEPELAQGDGIEYELIGYLNQRDELSDLSEDELARSLDHLNKVGLVRASGTLGDGMVRDKGEVERIGGLTPEGFKIAHERQLAEKEQQTKESLTFFTLILGFAAIVQATAAALQLENPSNTISLLLIIIVITFAMALYRTKVAEILGSWGRSILSYFRDLV
jgi:hypothetical protein